MDAIIAVNRSLDTVYATYVGPFGYKRPRRRLLGRALQRRLDVQPPQEHLQRQRRRLEILPQELEVRARLAKSRDR